MLPAAGFKSQRVTHSFCLGFFPLTLSMIDLGLLLLRAAGFLLAFTFGIQKIGWYVTAFHSGKPLSSIGLAPLIGHVGFPLPVILALVDHAERIGRRFLCRRRLSYSVRRGER